jgi:hypothetical protein
MVAPAEKILNRKTRVAGRSARSMDILSMNQNHPRSAPYCSDSHRLNSEFSRHVTGRINGSNTYQFVMSNPVGKGDPLGLSTGALPGWWGAFYFVPGPGWAYWARHKIGNWFAAAETEAYYAMQGQQAQVNWVNQAANPNSKPWQVPNRDVCPQVQQAYNAALNAGIKGGALPETPSGGPITTPGMTVGTNVAKGATTIINHGLGAATGGGAPTK